MESEPNPSLEQRVTLLKTDVKRLLEIEKILPLYVDAMQILLFESDDTFTSCFKMLIESLPDIDPEFKKLFLNFVAWRKSKVDGLKAIWEELKTPPDSSGPSSPPAPPES